MNKIFVVLVLKSCSHLLHTLKRSLTLLKLSRADILGALRIFSFPKVKGYSADQLLIQITVPFNLQ